MNTLDIHRDYMNQAIDLAKKGRGKVSPNPLVGCIIVKHGKVIGEGYHRKYGDQHAEVEALNNCIESPHDGDLYVNLEPCCIFGKTPPCIDAIIENSIKNVFIGVKDPNPKIDGDGVEKLRISGINVVNGILEKESLELNKGFFNWIVSSKPYVIAKVAQSKDGYMGINSETQTWITGVDVNKFTHKLRSTVDAIIIGRNTALVDNPRLTVREVLGNNPIRIIADTYRKLPLTLKLFNDNSSKNIVLCSGNKFEYSSTSFCEYVPVQEKNDKLNPVDILNVLGKKGITTLLLEGGRELFKSFIEKDLINEMYIYTSNKNLKDAKLLNPLIFDDSGWDVIDNKDFENDHLLIIRKKEPCFQE